MNTIVIYTQPDCPPCKIVKMFLNDKGIPFEEKNIATDSVAKKELIEVHQSFSTPTAVVNGEVVRGFDLEKLSSLLKLA